MHSIFLYLLLFKTDSTTFDKVDIATHYTADRDKIESRVFCIIHHRFLIATIKISIVNCLFAYELGNYANKLQSYIVYFAPSFIYSTNIYKLLVNKIWMLYCARRWCFDKKLFEGTVQPKMQNVIIIYLWAVPSMYKCICPNSSWPSLTTKIAL